MPQALAEAGAFALAAFSVSRAVSAIRRGAARPGADAGPSGRAPRTENPTLCQQGAPNMNRNPAITHRWIPPGGDLADASLIRRTVFVGEQGVSEEEEWDGLDPACDHIVLYADGRPVATGRIVWGRPVLLGRIAVLRECRGTGL